MKMKRSWSRVAPLAMLLAALTGGMGCSKETPVAASKAPVTIDPDIFSTDHPELFKTAKGKYVAPVPLEAKLGGNPRLSEVCVTGVGLPQPFALVTLSEETRGALACGLQQSDLVSELENLLNQVNDQFEDHERLDFLVVVKNPWTIEDGLLTPTMKIRRSVIEERYAAQTDAWSAIGQRVIFE